MKPDKEGVGDTQGAAVVKMAGKRSSLWDVREVPKVCKRSRWDLGPEMCTVPDQRMASKSIAPESPLQGMKTLKSYRTIKL